MACGLCEHMRARLRRAPYTGGPIPSQAGGGTARLRGAADTHGWNEGYWHHWVRLDLAPFGEWLADDLWTNQPGDASG